MASSEPLQAVPSGQRRQAWGHIRDLSGLLWQAAPGWLVASLILRLARAGLPAASLYVGKLIVDAVVLASRGGHGEHGLAAWTVQGNGLPLAALLAIECGLTILTNACGRASALSDGLLADRYSTLASLRVMGQAALLDLEQLEQSDEQDRLDRARRQVSGRNTLLFQILGQAQDAVTVATFVGTLLATAPWLVGLLCAALVPALLAETRFNAQSYRIDYRRTPERRQLDYLRYLGSSAETAKEVKLFGLGDFLAERFSRHAETLFEDNSRLARRRALWGTGLAALGTLAYYAAYAAIIAQTVAGVISLGSMVFLAGAFLRLRTLAEGLLLGLAQIGGQLLYLADLFAFLEATPRMPRPTGGRPVPSVANRLEFQGVGYRYPDARGWALRGLDLTIRAGEVLALVGANGAGKTTIVKLLTRLYDPDEGRILLDGHDLRDYDPADLRDRVGVIFQDFVRFHFTAGENIGVGRVAAIDDVPRVKDAARRSLADHVVNRLPGGYRQQLGRRFNDGAELSGGEWQKIAVARAYMREAGLLILDEPTAALDAQAEVEVFRRFQELSRGRTTVLISHRFSTVRMADRIAVLDGGHVVEIGDHAELLAAGGLYARMFLAQAEGYR